MTSEGLEALGSMDRFAINGFVEPLKRFPELLGILRHLERTYAQTPPDVFVGVDFNVFNLLLERCLKRRGIRTVHYVSPSVYAWRRGRIRRIGRAADLVLALYPFEPELYAARGVAAEFVGHPMADEVEPVADLDGVRTRLGLPLDATIVALLPGSRLSEIELMAEAFLDTAELLREQRPNVVFVVPCVTARIRAAMAERLARRASLDVRLFDGHARLPLSAADAALVKSGTGTLEAMLLRKPMVVTYRLPTVSYHLVKALKRSEFVALPNILAGRALVPELLQDAATPEAMAAALLAELSRTGSSAVLDEFARLHAVLRRGANERAAEAVLSVARRVAGSVAT